MKYTYLCALFIGAFLFLQPAKASTEPPEGVTCKAGETWLPSVNGCGVVAPEPSCDLKTIRYNSTVFNSVSELNSYFDSSYTVNTPPYACSWSGSNRYTKSITNIVTFDSSCPPEPEIVKSVVANLKFTKQEVLSTGGGTYPHLVCTVTDLEPTVTNSDISLTLTFERTDLVECPESHPNGPQSMLPPNELNQWCWRAPDRLPCDCSELQGMPKLPYGTFLAEKGVYTSSNLPECLDVVDSDTGQKCQCQFVAKKWLQFNAGFTHERWEPYPIENGGSSGTYTGAACNAEATSTAPDEKEECFTLKSGIKWCWANPDEKCSIVNGQEQCDSGCGYINGDFVCYETEEDPIIPKDPKPKDPIDDEITDPNKSINDMVKGDFKEVNRGIENRLNNVIITNENIESAVEGVENEVKKTNSKLDGIGKQLDGQGKTLKGIEKGIGDAFGDEGSPDGACEGDCTGSWYESAYPDGMVGIWQEHSEALQQTPMFGFLNQFQLSPNGTQPDLNVCFNLGAMGDFGCSSFEIPAIIWPFIKIVILISAAFLCRALIFGG